MEARQRQLKDWLTKIRTRQILLPRFQRYFTWSPNLAADFLTSILRDLPVGSALALGVGGEELPFISREILGAPAEGDPRATDNVNELVLDGQQRLTVLWRALNDLYTNTTFLVEINNEGKPEVIVKTRWTRNATRYPVWVDDPRQCWERKLIPLALLNPDDETSYQEWADSAAEGDAALARGIEHTITPLRGRLASFNLPFLYLPPETPKDVAVEVFIKLNTTYVSLTAFDIIVAQLEAATGEPLHDLVGSFAFSVPRIDEYTDPRNLVLPVSALFQEKPPNQNGYLNLDLDRFIDDWPKLVEGAKECVEFLEEERVFDSDRLPIESILAPLIALWSEAPTHPDVRGNVRILLKKYLWRAFFTERYDRAVPTAVLQDYRALKRVIHENAPENEVPCFDDEKYPLPTPEEILRSRWPRYKDRLARAILLLSIRGGAADIKDGSQISPGNIRRRHYHHLFPVAWLNQNDPGKNPNLALNCVLINMRTNSAISAKEPVQYLLESADASDLGEAEIRQRLASHFVNYDLVAAGDYDAYLKDHAQDVIQAVDMLCNGDSWFPQK